MKNRVEAIPVRFRRNGSGRRAVLKGTALADGPPIAIGIPVGLGDEASVGLAGEASPGVDASMVVDAEGKESLEVRCSCGQIHRIMLEYGETR